MYASVNDVFNEFDDRRHKFRSPIKEVDPDDGTPMKKRLKKIKTRMTARSSKLEELEKNSSESRKSSRPSSNRNKISKNLKDIEKAISLHDVNISFWPDQRVKVVDRACRDLIKLMSIGSDKMRDLEIEMQTFRQFKGHQTLVKLLFLGVFGRFLV